MNTFDLAVTFPAPGRIVVQSRLLFGDVDGPICRRFVERVFQAAEIVQVAIKTGSAPRAELRYCPRTTTVQHVVAQVAGSLGQGLGNAPDPANGRPEHAEPQRLPGARSARDRKGTVRYYRHDSVVTGWDIRAEQPGRLRLQNPALARNGALCRALERTLRETSGVEATRANAWTGVVRVDYDPARLSKTHLIGVLDAALTAVDDAVPQEKLDLHVRLCTASLPVAAAAQLAFPPLLPVAAAVCAYAALPTLRQAGHVLMKERRFGVDVLDAIVVLGCLGTLSVLPSAVLCWCRGVGRLLAERTQDRSQRLLLDTFRKEPRTAWLARNGAEVQVPVERLQPGDIVTVDAGDVVPVDGHVVGGLALIDQQGLNGATAAAEKGVGDRVFASTTMLAGRVYVAVEAGGPDTVSATIGRVLHETARHKPVVQRRAEAMADRAVVPALALGGIGLAAIGPGAGLAVLKSNVGAGLRSSAPYAVLGALARCAHRGIVVTDGRGLEAMDEVDTVIVDARVAVDRECLAVARVVALPGFVPEQILSLAAAAEQPFHHPIARAICQRALDRSAALSPGDDVQYQVGQGISARVEGHLVRVGSRRFLENGLFPLPCAVPEDLEVTERPGRETVLVGVDDRLAGAVELEAAVRPELRDVVAGLRRRGVERIAIVAGDQPELHQRLAEALGPEQRFVPIGSHAEADPRGRKVCYVGESGDDAPEAEVRIAVRGSAALATGTAEIVFFDGELAKLCDLRDIARDLARNVQRSWSLILAPNIACIVGVFTLGLGIMTSVVIHNAAALAALANSVLPLRQVARIEAERRHREELNRNDALERDPL